ncbi:MAG: alpha/beta hydrolase [Acidimicrobiales bacterium]
MPEQQPPVPPHSSPGSSPETVTVGPAAGRPGPGVLPGAEPFSAPGGPHGALVLHGFTGSPQSMRSLARALADAGFAVELPLLPGHGTTVEDMATTGWSDWSAAAEAAYRALAARCERVVVAGLSMGGSLTVWLASRHPEIAGAVVVNPAIDPPAPSFREMLQGIIDSGTEFMPAIGGDLADPDAHELAYEAIPVRALLSMCEASDDLEANLGRVSCPVLIMTSPQDHVVPPVSSSLLAERVSGPVERVTLERSYHVATLDYDREEVERRAVEFARKVTSG